MGRVSYDYSSKVVLVTGAGSGIGQAVAQAFAGTGATLAVADIKGEAAEATAAAIRVAGGTAEAFTLDVARESEVQRFVGAVVDRFGGLDIAINNAGISADVVPLAELSSEVWQRVIDVNLTSIFHCMKAEIRQFLASGTKAAIVNTASVSGIMAGYNLSAYTASKHGVMGLTKAAAMDYAAKGIRINALCPGLTQTPFVGNIPDAVWGKLGDIIPLGFAAQPRDIAGAVLWLCSDAASYVTGHALVVDGGASVGSTGTRAD